SLRSSTLPLQPAAHPSLIRYTTLFRSPVVTRREDVGEHGQVHDLFHGLVAIGKDQQVPVRVGHQDVLGLTAHPAAHVHVPVGRPRLVGVDVEADLGDRKSTRLNSSHVSISYAVFCLKKNKLHHKSHNKN